MNKTIIIGNLTADPQVRSFTDGESVCNFRVAVNRPSKDGSKEADFFNVSAWGRLGENCAKFLSKGKKVCVTGPVSARAFTRQDQSVGASLEINAREVEFLSARGEDDGSSGGAYVPAQEARQAEVTTAAAVPDVSSGMQPVDVDDLPF
ncbi:MAG: single-stranded DNA-binding protein [Clostridia bacterium]|nr:single-stranded DNA-binding protein [Clostridia bacterium]